MHCLHVSSESGVAFSPIGRTLTEMKVSVVLQHGGRTLNIPVCGPGVPVAFQTKHLVSRPMSSAQIPFGTYCVLVGVGVE